LKQPNVVEKQVVSETKGWKTLSNSFFSSLLQKLSVNLMAGLQGAGGIVSWLVSQL
jgi:hypothetical protein